MPTLSRIAVASVVALAAGISSSVLLGGFSINPTFHLIQVIALGVLGVAVIFGGAILIAFRLSDYTNPESEAEFEALVIESERLARQGLAVEPDEEEFLDLDPFNDEDFEELVRDALDDLPDLLREALQRNVAVVISNRSSRTKKSSSTLIPSTTRTLKSWCATRSMTCPTCCARRFSATLP